MPQAKKIAVLVIGVVTVVGGVLWYAYRPTAAVEKALTKVAELDTAHFQTRIVVANAEATTQLLGQEGEIEIVIDGAIDRREQQQDNLAGTVVVTTRTEGVTVDLTGEIRMIDDKVYVYIERAPQLFPVLVQLKGRWLMFNRGGTAAETSAETTGELFTTVQRVGTDTVDGHITVHYQTVATDQAIVQMMDGIAEALGTQLSDAQIAQIRSSAAQVEQVPVDLWIDRFTTTLRQIRTTLAVPGGNTVAFTLLFKDVNKPVDISVPAEPQTLQEAVAEIRATAGEQ